MARFARFPNLVTGIQDGLVELQARQASKGEFDGHDLINWLDQRRNKELNSIYDLYNDCRDPEMTADQQIGKFLYTLDQIKIGERLSPRRITRRNGTNRNGTCKVSVWEISPQTCFIHPTWLRWNNCTIEHIAREIDQDGELKNFGILADALEDAGCRNPLVLGHCRQMRSVQERRSWVVDLLLGR